MPPGPSHIFLRIRSYLFCIGRIETRAVCVWGTHVCEVMRSANELGAQEVLTTGLGSVLRGASVPFVRSCRYVGPPLSCRHGCEKSRSMTRVVSRRQLARHRKPASIQA